VVGVLLYGSLARGDHAPGSDADLLIVVDRSPFPPRLRAQHLPPLRLPICHEKLVYTDDEIRKLRADGNLFLHRVLREGRWLARSQSWDPDPPNRIAATPRRGEVHRLG
jgi:predicted nucleotidyltransferase